jgi:hypothetical protein
MDIMAMLAAVNAAIDITKKIGASDRAIEAVEMKLQMAELLERLAEMKIAMTEIQDDHRVKDAEIARLKEAFAFRDETVEAHDLRYRKNDEGKPTGQLDIEGEDNFRENEPILLWIP